jgi:outer membrane receptor protein involved in Fe transport
LEIFMTTFHKRRLLLVGALGAAFFLTNTALAWAQEAAGTVSGRVSSGDGTPVGDAVVDLRRNESQISARTDAEGHFVFASAAPGSYAVAVRAPGFDALTNRTIGVRSGATVEVTLTLLRSSSSLVTIGRVQVGGGDALSTSSTPSTSLNPDAYAEQGYTRVSDVLQDDIATTLVRPLGGMSVLPTSVALRGPDPTETLVDIDGHQVNNGNTGDFDLSLLDPADYGSIELVKGISPSSLVGPDTIDGAINIRTIEPTVTPHGLVRLSGGSFDSFGETLQSTGTLDRIGYAISLHRTTSDGEVNQTIFDATTGRQAQIGSGSSGSSALAKLRYAFGRSGDGYVEFSFHDQSQFRDLSAALSSVEAPPGVADSDDSIGRYALSDTAAATRATAQVLDGFEGTTLQTHNAGYGLDVRVPIGGVDGDGIARTSALFRHYSSLVSESVTGPGSQTSSYLYNNHDVVTDDTLELDRQFAHAALTFQYGVRNENLTTDFLAGVVNDESIARRAIGDSSASMVLDDVASDGIPAASTLGLAQTQRSAVLRYAYDPTSKLHLTAAGYYSNYSIFGTSLDPRFGVTYDPDARSVVRFSLGTTYQSPQLPELYVPPVLPQAVGGYVSVGNPNLKPDRATEYGLGVEHIFETGLHRTDVSVDFYRVNLRAPASVYLPQLDPNCGAVSAGGDGTACPLSYPINAGDGIYQGVEISGQRRIAPFTIVRAAYAVRSAYLTNVPADIQDGTLVAGEQALGLPLQKATLGVQGSPPLGFTYSAGMIYEGQYNELDRPQFATINAGVGYRWPALALSLSATNLTDVYDQRFTLQGVGVPYAGLTGPIATDAYSMQGTALTFTVTHRF